MVRPLDHWGYNLGKPDRLPHRHRICGERRYCHPNSGTSTSFRWLNDSSQRNFGRKIHLMRAQEFGYECQYQARSGKQKEGSLREISPFVVGSNPTRRSFVSNLNVCFDLTTGAKFYELRLNPFFARRRLDSSRIEARIYSLIYSQCV